MQALSQEFLDDVFPAKRTAAFFEALFGGAEDGAYDIRLTLDHAQGDKALLRFELLQRPGQCLACNLTYGLPQVFSRHPVINLADVARQVAEKLGWEKYSWELGKTNECSHSLHFIPFNVNRV